MKNDLTTGAWQHNIGCPISITLLSTSDVVKQASRLLNVNVEQQQFKFAAWTQQDDQSCGRMACNRIFDSSMLVRLCK